MMRQQEKNSVSISEGLPTATAATDLSAAEVYIDDEWLEALLDNLALVNLSRAQCVALIEQIEAIERSEPAASIGEPAFSSVFGRSLIASYRSATPKIVVGGQFTAEFNDYEMRAPSAMTPENVCDTIERAARRLRSRGHIAAVRQIVFFISTNMEEVIDESDED